MYTPATSNIINIKAENNIQIKSVQLFDVRGKSIYINLSNNNTLDVSSLSEGIYLLNIFSDNGQVSKKLVVKK